jgi:hypothetical protein
MSWVEQASGSERMPRILASHSTNAVALKAHLGLYRTIMFAPSPLSRSEREAIAVMVSVANDCHY